MTSETTQERRARIAAEAAHLLDGGVWADEVANRLGYADAGNLCTVLRGWGYPQLADRFNRVVFDGLAGAAHRAAYERRRGAVV